MSTPVPTKRTGLSRVLHAFTYSIDGLKTGWGEPAFRQEALLAIPLVPLAFVIGANWMETAMLIAVVVFVMVTELLNTAVEAAIDRIGPEWHAISKRAKDLGSAAVMLSLLLCGGVWLAALWAWW
jgi:diacylglycerol kinase (ATP)